MWGPVALPVRVLPLPRFSITHPHTRSLTRTYTHSYACTYDITVHITHVGSYLRVLGQHPQSPWLVFPGYEGDQLRRTLEYNCDPARQSWPELVLGMVEWTQATTVNLCLNAPHHSSPFYLKEERHGVKDKGEIYGRVSSGSCRTYQPHPHCTLLNKCNYCLNL